MPEQTPAPSPLFYLAGQDPHSAQVFLEVPRPWGHRRRVAAWLGHRSHRLEWHWAHSCPSLGLRWTRGSPRVCCALTSYASPASYDVSACRLLSVCVLVCCLGAGVFCMFSDKCVPPAQAPTTIEPRRLQPSSPRVPHVCPAGGPRPGQGSVLLLPLLPVPVPHEAHCVSIPCARGSHALATP